MQQNHPKYGLMLLLLAALLSCGSIGKPSNDSLDSKENSMFWTRFHKVQPPAEDNPQPLPPYYPIWKGYDFGGDYFVFAAAGNNSGIYIPNTYENFYAHSIEISFNQGHDISANLLGCYWRISNMAEPRPYVPKDFGPIPPEGVSMTSPETFYHISETAIAASDLTCYKKPIGRYLGGNEYIQIQWHSRVNGTYYIPRVDIVIMGYAPHHAKQAGIKIPYGW